MKEDLTMTNKQMLVAQLRKEQEKNRILRKELEEANQQRRLAEKDAMAAIYMFNDESRKVQSHNGFLQSVISHSKDMLDEAVKQAKIDVLNELKKKAWQSHCSFMRIVNTEQIDEFIEEIKK